MAIFFVLCAAAIRPHFDARAHILRAANEYREQAAVRGTMSFGRPIFLGLEMAYL